ncbi:MAG: hypothetical protein H7Y38_11280 [Armatimonadetes bacterium]|nr:hypothetical protein [Armatimonadota bacterium]
MNYLAHHFLARRSRPAGSADFCAGNLLPDLLAAGSDPRLRSVSESVGDLADGVRLHLATDKTFHGSAAFADTQKQANALLLSAPWATAPRRRFFVAHVLVELALDAHILHRFPDLPTDLYAALSQSLAGGLVAQAETLLGKSAPNLYATTTRFIESGFLRDYAAPEGLADSLTRVCHRAGVPNFETAADRETLAQVFDDFAPILAPFVPEMLPSISPVVVQ